MNNCKINGVQSSYGTPGCFYMGRIKESFASFSSRMICDDEDDSKKNMFYDSYVSLVSVLGRQHFFYARV